MNELGLGDHSSATLDIQSIGVSFCLPRSARIACTPISAIERRIRGGTDEHHL
jgi:hypothetical protein